MAGGGQNASPGSNVQAGGTVNPANYTSLSDFNHAYVDQARADGKVDSVRSFLDTAKAGSDTWNQYQQTQGGGTGVARPPAGGKQAGNPMPPPSGSLDAYAQPYSGPVGGGTPPSMTPTPPTNPLPAPPQPQVQPAMRPPYGGPQRGPGSSFEGGMDPFGPRGGYGNLPPDRMPRRDMFDRDPFSRREQQPGGPTRSQQGGVFNYNPNGPQQGGFNPFGNAPARPNAVPGQFRQMMQPQSPGYGGLNPANLPAGLGAINPYNQAAAQQPQPLVQLMPGKPLTLEELKQTGAQVGLNPAYGQQLSSQLVASPMSGPGKPLTLEELMQPQVTPLNPAYGQQLSSQSVASPMSGGQLSQDMLQQTYQDFLQQQRIK